MASKWIITAFIFLKLFFVSSIVHAYEPEDYWLTKDTGIVFSLYQYRLSFPDSNKPSSNIQNWPEHVNLSKWQEITRPYHVSVQDPEGRYYPCRYETAKEVLETLECDKHSKKYIEFWINNQQRLFHACASDKEIKLVVPNDPSFPKRALEDYQYQKAVQLHYLEDEDKNEQAQQLFYKILSNENNHYQKHALFNFLSYIRENEGYGKLFNVTGKLLKNAALEKLQYEIEDQRFIAFFERTTDYEEKQFANVAADTLYLRWFLDIVENREPAISVNGDMKRYLAERKEKAFYHIDTFLMFTSGGETPRTAWWLDHYHSYKTYLFASPKMQALRNIVSQNNLLDWLQTNTVKNPNKDNWKWVLYDGGNLLWKDQEALKENALSHYNNRDGMEWLLSAAERVGPGEKDIEFITNELVNLLEKKHLFEGQDYFSYHAWTELVRIHLVNNNDDKAINYLIKGAELFPHNKALIQANSEPYRNALEWFIHKGDWAKARLLLRGIEQNKQILNTSYKKIMLAEFQIILSNNTEELVEVLKQDYRLQSKQSWMGFTPVWDHLSVDTLYDLSPKEVSLKKENDTDSENQQLVFLRSAFMRAWLLGDQKNIKRFAYLYNKLSRYTPGALPAPYEDGFQQTLFILKQPRFKPVMTPSEYGSGYGLRNELKDNEIDSYQISANNWWCQNPVDKMRFQLEQSWEFMPNMFLNLKYDHDLYQKARIKALENHPVWTLSNKQELSRLGEIAKAPEYLSNKVIAYASQPLVIQKWRGQYDDMPEALHRAVKSTRYGCRRQGPHGEYSRKAYELLHQKFPQSKWTKMTPYWFDRLSIPGQRRM